MIAVADYAPLTYEYRGPDDVDADDLWIAISLSRHNRSVNAVFCDTHVESAKTNQWTAKSDTARRRWNNDHQPHWEGWFR
jgi:prepilin-type processing-associated H-X9-DG protein